MWDDWGDDEKSKGSESINWGEHLDKDTDVNQNPSGAFNKLSEALRQSFPHEATCSMFCGGRKCKYCCDEGWKDDEQAVKGLYSHWVTENILATSRPITRYVEKYDIIKNFGKAGLSAIINLQLPGEHAACGDGVHDGEFSYKQQQFMDGGVFFYNFGWKDFGVVESMTALLDMVKVMEFAVSEGKVAVHCHAGRGRTGVLIACFLVFHNRMTANEAVHYVRSRRPHSVQTAPQVKCVQDFERFLKPYRVVFSQYSTIASFNLSQYLMRQRGVLHGYQARKLKFLPWIVYILCERMLKLAKKPELLHIPEKTSLSVELETSSNALSVPINSKQSGSTSDLSDDPVLNPRLSKPQPHGHSNGVHGQGKVAVEVNRVGQALASDSLSATDKEKVESYKKRLNEEDVVVDELKQETNANILATLLWDWLDQLKDPVVRSQDTNLLLSHQENPHIALGKMEKGTKTTVTYLLEFMVRLQPISEDLECDILQKLISLLTHKSVDSVEPSSASCQDLRTSTNSLTELKNAERFGFFRFFYNLLESLEDQMMKKQTSSAAKSSME